MSSALRRLFEEIIAEAENRPEFGRRLEAAISSRAVRALSVASISPKHPRRNRRAPGVLDPFDIFAKGEPELRRQLANLTVEQLKDVVSENAIDSSKLALKWRSPDRLIDLIVSTVRARVEKGDAFKRDFVPPSGL